VVDRHHGEMMSQEHDVVTRDENNRGSNDGDGDADHDQPFAGFRSYCSTCGELLEARLGNGRWAADLASGG
jgi:hypothetical protein